MPRDTPSMAKNKIKRSLSAIYDPHPSKTEVNCLWEYFDSCCAYCGVPLQRESRIGHLDHLVPSTESGSNGIHNHALSCARCNGDERREESWQSFLSKKSSSEAEFQERKSRIDYWISLTPIKSNSENFENKANEIIQEAIDNFESSVEKMRKLRARGGPNKRMQPGAAEPRR